MRRRNLGRFVLLLCLAVLVAGCTITVEGGGRARITGIVVEVYNIPGNVARMEYKAKLDGGWSLHTISRSARGGSDRVEFENLRTGTWTLEVTGRDTRGRTVVYHERRVFVRKHRLARVRIWDFD